MQLTTFLLHVQSPLGLEFQVQLQLHWQTAHSLREGP